jgi:hypothetical protein
LPDSPGLCNSRDLGNIDGARGWAEMEAGSSGCSEEEYIFTGFLRRSEPGDEYLRLYVDEGLQEWIAAPRDVVKGVYITAEPVDDSIPEAVLWIEPGASVSRGEGGPELTEREILAGEIAPRTIPAVEAVIELRGYAEKRTRGHSIFTNCMWDGPSSLPS